MNPHGLMRKGRGCLAWGAFLVLGVVGLFLMRFGVGNTSSPPPRKSLVLKYKSKGISPPLVRTQVTCY
jgi:hypothetical protein